MISTVPISTEERREMPGSVMKGWLGMLVVVMIIIQLFSGRFSCEGKYDEVCCKFRHHAINPYQSYEARILFSTWNLDHRVEKSRTVIPGLVRAVQVVWRPLIGPDPFRYCSLIGWTSKYCVCRKGEEERV